MNVILNIGLESRDAAGNVVQLNHEEVCEFIYEQSGCSFFGAIHESHTEQTLVLEFVYAELRETIATSLLAHLICDRFNQDCVAVYLTGLDLGQLIGPRSESWGEFNRHYFFLVDGTHPAAVVPEVLQ